MVTTPTPEFTGYNRFALTRQNAIITVRYIAMIKTGP
jgi:hypothetical protein